MKLPLACLLLLAGCAAEEARYPSLAPRAGERLGFDEPAVAAPGPAVPDPALDTRIAALGVRLDTVARGFDIDAAKARSASAGRGTRTVGSDAWLAAQAALAGLDDWRAQATALASEAEAAGAERLAQAGAPYPALDALQARAATEAERQGRVTTELSAALPTP